MKLPLRVLVLCTGNSARSQIAEALLNAVAPGRITGASAGSRPAAQANPLALETLRRHGIAAPSHPPQGIGAVEGEPWDVVITVCDNARDACPYLPGARRMVHWGMPDPAEAEGDRESRLAQFEAAFRVLQHRIGRLAALPLESMEESALQPALLAIYQDA